MTKVASTGNGLITWVVAVLLLLIAFGLPLWHFGFSAHGAAKTGAAGEAGGPNAAPDLPLDTLYPVSGDMAWINQDIPIASVAITRVQLAADAGTLRCSYAELIRIAGSRANPPDEHWSNMHGRDIVWHATPAPPSVLRNAVFPCARYWFQSVNQRALRALRSDGSWYAALSEGDAILIYSLPQEIAVFIEKGL